MFDRYSLFSIAGNEPELQRYALKFFPMERSTHKKPLQLEHRRILPCSLQRRLSKIVAIDDILTSTDTASAKDTACDTDDDENSVDQTVIIEPKCDPRPIPNAKPHWLSEFCSQTRRDRIKWNSKLHQYSKHFSAKSLYEQVEELVDIAAEEFTDWLNKLSSDKQNEMSKEMIKQLFALGIEDNVQKSMNVQMKLRPSVAQEVANMFECPELSIERKVQELLAADRRLEKTPAKYVAFGRALSPSSRHFKAQTTKCLTQSEFPDDIRSGKLLFGGIDHLKSSKALIKHIEQTKKLPRPKYLVDAGAFERETDAKALNHVSLYSHFQ